MARKSFFSFHYQPDCWRVSQVRNMGVVEGNTPVSDNDWESVTKGGDTAIKKWIADQLSGKSCTIVLVGENTAGRKWVTYEISESWNAGKGVVGIRIHKLKNKDGYQGASGPNPFGYVNFTDTSRGTLASVVKLYAPSGNSSTEAYNNIKANTADWVEEAIYIRDSN
jgi:hypothetical protein